MCVGGGGREGQEGPMEGRRVGQEGGVGAPGGGPTWG